MTAWVVPPISDGTFRDDYHYALLMNIASLRELLDPVFPHPTIGDSIDFSLTELGEIIDARLRKTPKYLRNHEKEIDIASEIGDAFFMIGTALTDLCFIPSEVVPTEDRFEMLLATVVSSVALARIDVFKGDRAEAIKHLSQAWGLLSGFGLLQGITPDDALHRTVDKLMTKYLSGDHHDENPGD